MDGPLIQAQLVYDGGDAIRIPDRLGKPADNQLQGTVLEQLCELSGRACYDSLGRGRASDAYHEHILEVGHLSVTEHATFCVTVEYGHALGVLALLPYLQGRPGVHVTIRGPHELTIRMNLRAAIEWDRWNPGEGLYHARSHHRRGGDFFGPEHERRLYRIAKTFGHLVAPQLVKHEGEKLQHAGSMLMLGQMEAKLVNAYTPDDATVSLYLSGSRGLSHEQVRHKFDTAVSQRSTRYVDESRSPWVRHPLLQAYYDYVGHDDAAPNKVAWEEGLIADAKGLYDMVVMTLERWLIEQGKDKQTARKQARGAARGYLGNALFTEMIFTASVRQWRWMLHMRGSAPADAEIRQLFAGTDDDYPSVIRALQQSNYGEMFADIEVSPSPDGLARVVTVPNPGK